MNLKYAMAFIMWYAFLSLFYIFGSALLGLGVFSYMDEGAITPIANITYNDTNSTVAAYNIYYHQSNAFNTIVNFTLFVFTGIGLPAATPAWIMIIFGVFETCLSILAALLIASAIWIGGG